MRIDSSGARPGSKSFVIRNSRITKSQKGAIEALSKDYLISEKELNSSKDSFLSDQKELILDIGFGSGESLLHLARNFSKKNFLGIEVYLSGIGSVLRQADKEGLTNLKIINGDAREVLRNPSLDSKFNSVLFLFPDPWPKKRHNKRRLVKSEFIKELSKKVKTNGQVLFKSDWEQYFDESREAFLSNPMWLELKSKEFKDEFNDLPQTRFERKAINSGRIINSSVFKRLA